MATANRSLRNTILYNILNLFVQISCINLIIANRPAPKTLIISSRHSLSTAISLLSSSSDTIPHRWRRVNDDYSVTLAFGDRLYSFVAFVPCTPVERQDNTTGRCQRVELRYRCTFYRSQWCWTTVLRLLLTHEHVARYAVENLVRGLRIFDRWQ